MTTAQDVATVIYDLSRWRRNRQRITDRKHDDGRVLETDSLTNAINLLEEYKTLLTERT